MVEAASSMKASLKDPLLRRLEIYNCWSGMAAYGELIQAQAEVRDDLTFIRK